MPATPSLATIRSAVVLAVQTAMNPGSPGTVNTVNDYRRFWRDDQQFQKLFQRTDAASGFTGKINGWMIKIQRKEVEAPEWFRYYVKHQIELHGYMGVQDAGSTKTEKDFLDQIDAVCDQLRLNLNVFGNTEVTSPVVSDGDAQVVEIGQKTCWYTVLRLEVERIDTRFS